eukprot:6950701-Prymnesium_polylepis.3
MEAGERRGRFRLWGEGRWWVCWRERRDGDKAHVGIEAIADAIVWSQWHCGTMCAPMESGSGVQPWLSTVLAASSSRMLKDKADVSNQRG